MVPGKWVFELEKDTGPFENLFPPETQFVFVETHPDDTPIACGCLLGSIASRRKCVITTCLIDGNLGVFDDYALDWAKRQGVPLRDATDLAKIKDAIRFKEINMYADTIPCPHIPLGLNWNVIEPVYRKAPAGYSYLDAHSSRFEDPSYYDRLRIERLVTEQKNAVFVMHSPRFYFPNSTHAHHHISSRLFLQAIAKKSPNSKLLFFSTENEKRLCIERDNLIFYFNDETAEQNFERIDICFPSQNFRRYKSRWYGLVVARNLSQYTCGLNQQGPGTYNYADGFQFCELI
jgi:hypothetical protein